MAKLIRVIDEEKQFEAFLKVSMTLTESNGEKRLVGVAIAGTPVACRAVHAALYTSTKVEIYDEETGKSEYVLTTRNYRRIETVIGKVCHMFALPRTSVNDEYQEALMEARKTDNATLPERIVMAKKNDIHKDVGLFLASTFGLPKLDSWKLKYLDIFKKKGKIEEIEVETTALAGEFHDLKAVKIASLKEKEVFDIIEEAIFNGTLKVKRDNVPESLKSVQAVFEEGMTAEEYIKRNAEIIAAKFKTSVKTLYDGKSFFPYFGEMSRICLPSQARAVMGMYHVLREKGAGFLVGDMGTGKTMMSLSTAYVIARNREDSGAKKGMSALIIAPSNVLPKWATSEIPTAFGKEKTEILNMRQLQEKVKFKRPFKSKFLCTIIDSTEEALAYCRLIKSGWKVPKGMIHFILVSTDRMKLTAERFVLGARWNHYRQLWISPNTGMPLQTPKSNKQKNVADLYATWSDVVELPQDPPTEEEIKEAKLNGTLGKNGLPKAYVKKWVQNIRSFQDNYKEDGKKDCSLARPAQKKWGEVNKKHRWMIAQIFQRKLKNHFHVGIFDEVHQMKAIDSGRGAAFHKLLKACRKSMFLTGTLTNGESSSIFAPLWRAFPRELIEQGFSHKTSTETWASRYGVIERTTTLEDGDQNIGVTTNRMKERVRVVERPGIAPQLIANHLLDKSIFVELPDLGIPLVQLIEEPIIVELDDEHLEEYKRLHTDFYDTAMKLQREIGPGAWAKFNPTTINYADQPSIPVHIEWRDKRDNLLLASVQAPAFPKDYLTTKERKLIEIVQKELSQNRPCIVYTNYTGAYKTNERLYETLKNAGIEAKILNEKISPNARFDWIEKTVNEGTKVVITNMKLVEVGLDLMHFPTIIYYQLCDEVSTLRQSSRRSWRLGAKKTSKVYYLINSETQQMVQFRRLMSRRVAAMITEGRIERSDELAKYASLSAGNLTNDLSKLLADSEILTDWQKAAQKDLSEDLELVSEEEFEERLSNAFKVLTEETIQLCGYVPSTDTIEKELKGLFDDFDESILDDLFKDFDESILENFVLEDTTSKPVTTSSNVIEFKKKQTEKSEEVYEHFEQLSLFDFA